MSEETAVLAPAAPLPLGMIADEAIEVYHASNSASHSKLEVLRDLDRGPLRYFMQYVAKTLPRPAAKDHFDVGSAFDCLLLEGEKAFEERVVTQPATYGPENKPWHGGAKECKEFDRIHRGAGRIILSSEENALVMAMFAAVRNNPHGVALLSTGVPQMTFRAAFRACSVQVRPDWWNHTGITLPGETEPIGPYIVDVKTAEDLDRFIRNRVDFGYDRQAALYTLIVRHVLADIAQVHVDEIPAVPFFFLVVFKTAPVDTVVFRLSDDDIGTASDEVMNDLLLLQRCHERNEWPGSPRGVHVLPTPRKWKGKDIF